MIEATVLSLLNVSSITSIVGTYNNAPAIWPNEPLTNGNFANIVYNCSKAASIFDLGGPSGIAELELELTLETSSVQQQIALSSAVKAILNGYSGQPIQGCFLTDESVEKISDEEEGTRYSEDQTYRVIYNENQTYVASASSGSFVVPISQGGTGQATAMAALDALLPSQTGNSGEVLTTDGTSISWQSVTAPMTPTWALALGTNATTGTNLTNPLAAPFNGTITNCLANAGTGPTGSALIFDILKNGTSIWATHTSNRIQIAAGQTSGTQTSFDTTSVSAGDVFTVNIAQIGSSVAGSNLTVLLVINT